MQFFLDLQEFSIGYDGIFLPSFFMIWAFSVTILIASVLSVRLSAMPYAIDNDCIFFNFEQNPVITDAQPVFRRRISKALYVSA